MKEGQEKSLGFSLLKLIGQATPKHHFGLLGCILIMIKNTLLLGQVKVVFSPFIQKTEGKKSA